MSAAGMKKLLQWCCDNVDCCGNGSKDGFQHGHEHHFSSDRIEWKKAKSECQSRHQAECVGLIVVTIKRSKRSCDAELFGHQGAVLSVCGKDSRVS